MEIELLSVAIFISAIIAIYFRQQDNIKLHAIFKPLTTILIIILSVIIFKNHQSVYAKIMIVALIFSLIGDVFLIRNKYFLQGLISFLVAHICFTIGFASLYGFYWNVIPLVCLILVCGFYYLYLKKDLNKFAIPVLVYISIIVIMNWQAIGLYINSGNPIFVGVAIASLLFTFSDSIIAYEKFKSPFKLANVIILSTYWISIYLFTMAGLFIE